MTPKLSSWQQFPLRPGQWYMGSQVAALANGPWQPAGIIGTGKTQPWGEGGIDAGQLVLSADEENRFVVDVVSTEMPFTGD